MLATLPRRADARIYRGLALAYHQPTPDLLQPAYLDELRNALAAAGAGDLVGHVEVMGEGLMGTPDLTGLTVAYCKLFFGPGTVAAPPYESVYLGGGVTMGEPAIAVSRRYAEAGVQVWAGFKNCPDHIAAELEFLYFTAGQAAAFRALGRAETARIWAERHTGLLRHHLCRWAGRFCTQVLAGTDHRFYQGLARLTQAWVERAAGR